MRADILDSWRLEVGGWREAPLRLRRVPPVGGLGLVVVVWLLLWPGVALGAWGESFFTGQVGYVPATVADVGILHAPTVTLGGGYYVSDFSLVEGNVHYSPAWKEGDFYNVWAAEASFRLIIDATQWIPSVGPTVGWLFGQSESTGFMNDFYLGATACMEYRGQRSHGWGICGEAAAVPFGTEFSALYGIGVRFTGFMPFIFE